MASLLVCNFLVHDKCLKLTTNPCVSVAATIVKVGKMSVARSMSIINDFLQESCCPLLDRWENNQRKILQCLSEENARSSWHQMWGWVFHRYYCCYFCFKAFVYFPVDMPQKMFIFMKLFDDLCSLLKCLHPVVSVCDYYIHEHCQVIKKILHPY